LAIGPGMLDLGQPMFDPVLLAAHVEHMRRISCRRAVRIARWEGELDPIVGENRVNLLGDSREQSFEEAWRALSGSLDYFVLLDACLRRGGAAV
jgi:hypothetical protein